MKLALTLLGALAAAPASAQATLILTPEGLGPVKIGMTQKQVIAALGGTLEGAAIESDDICVEKESSVLRGVGFMFEDGKLTRISLGEGTDITTPRGIGVGAAAIAVRYAYRGKLKSEPNTYIEKPAEYLTYWTVPGKRGVRFEVDEKRKVYVIHAGGPSIQYVEGCA
jgi:hypothetical protein